MTEQFEIPKTAAKIASNLVTNAERIKQAGINEYKDALKKKIEDELFEELPETREKINKLIDSTTV